MNNISQRTTFGILKPWAVPAVVWAFALPQAAMAGFVVGVEFVDQTLPGPAWDSDLGLGAYTLTNPSSPFGNNGALTGYSETMLRGQIVAAVQEAFRSADIGQPGRMLDVNIVQGAVPPATGTVLLVAADTMGTGLAGESIVGSAVSRPDLIPGSIYTNEWSVTLVNNIADMPVVYHTAAEVVNAVAGTAAHEITHTLGVVNHVSGSPINGVYPIMASGASAPSLPIDARLTLREFLDIPGTEPDGRSVTEVLLDSAGTTSVTDFNFDGVTNVLDYNILMANFGSSGTGVKTGDANDDGMTDINDYNMVMANIPEPSALTLLSMGFIGLVVHARWRQRPRL